MIQMIDVCHEVVMIAFQIIPDSLPVKEIGKKTGDQKKRKRIEYIPRSNCGRVNHPRQREHRIDAHQDHQNMIEDPRRLPVFCRNQSPARTVLLRRDDAILFTFILHHGTALL